MAIQTINASSPQGQSILSRIRPSWDQPITVPSAGLRVDSYSPSQVQGVQTQQQPTSGGGGTGGNQSDWERAGHAGIAPAGYHGESGVNMGDLNNEISEAYGPALEALGMAESSARTGATGQEETVGRNYESEAAKAAAEKGQLTSETGQRQNQFNKTIRSAYEDAVRAYNALNQQRTARFGGGSSAGGAIGELASQEYFRQQGSIGEQQTQGDLQFANEFSKIGTYIGNKLTDLDNWKKDTMTQIKQNLSDTLVSIAQRRGDIEANKTKDKLAALQGAVARVQSVQDADKSFRQNLALASISQAQEISGRAFTPSEINARLSEWGIPMTGVSSGGGQGGGTANIRYNPATGKYEDELGNAVNV